MSHELRTPLNGIIGFSELLEDGHTGTLNPEQRVYVEHILTSGRHLLQLVNDLLDLSKLDAGRLTLSREWSSIESIVESAIDSVGRLAKEHGVTINLEIAGELPALFVDPYRMRQVAANLVLNGMKRTPEGGHVTMSVRSVGQTVCVTVEDDGPAISDDELRMLFRSFEELDSENEASNDPADLGLALAKRLVDMHGGTIEIASVREGGATFEVILPATSHATDHVSVVPITPSSTDQVVLVVDDDPQARELIAGHLLALGVGVVFARSASAAIELAQTMKPNAITLDIEMPGTDGWATLQQLKRSHTSRDIPVLVISITDESQRAGRLGATDFVPKPVAKHRLIEAMERAGVAVHVLDDTKVLLLDRDNPDFDRIESKLRRAGCVVTRPGAASRDTRLIEGHDLILVDTTTASDDAASWLDTDAAQALPLLLVGASNAATSDTRECVARTTLDETLAYPERLIRAVHALIANRRSGSVGGKSHDAR